MKALITDVFNNINFELCCRMLEEGNEVIGIDQVKENEEQSNKEEKYMHIGRNANFSFIDGRIDSLSSDTKKSIGDIDVIFQISQKGDKSYYKAKENSDNMNSLIKIAKENTRLVYLSSYEVYGNLFGVVDESTEKKPKTPYGLRLFYEEQIIQEQNDVKYVILRTPEIYGTWNSRQSLKKMKASDVIYIDDVVNALMVAAETTHVHEVFNLTTRSGANSREFRIDGKKAKQLLGFKQTVSLEKGKRMLYNSRNSNKNESKGNL